MLNQIETFDVLVVYSESIATSASLTDSSVPFDEASCRSHYNDSYRYFLKACSEEKVKAAFTTSADIIGPGLCRTYWTYSEKRWEKHLAEAHAKVIFNKFSPTSKKLREKRALLFSDPDIKPLNSIILNDLFFDKLKTYKKFPTVSIPTVAIHKRNRLGIKKAICELKDICKIYSQKGDFSTELVLKDRYGSGGYNIHKIDRNDISLIEKIISQHQTKKFIIQPYVQFESGYQKRGVKGAVDIRLIFLGTSLVQTYIRVAGENDFRCNEHQGGLLMYVSRSDIPRRVIKMAQRLSEVLNVPHCLFALDFIISNNGKVYFLEGNSKPGLDWNANQSENERMTKKLIRVIVKELKQRVHVARFPEDKLRSKSLPDIYGIPFLLPD